MIQLQYISRPDEHGSHITGIRHVLQQGVRWVQLRIKGANAEDVMYAALECAELCRNYGATFIVNDNVDVAVHAKADGVHLGKNDMPVSKARQLLGTEMYIGATANTVDDMLEAQEAGASYIGLGPFRHTTTKDQLSPVLGVEGSAASLQAFHQNGGQIPVVLIGGLQLTDVHAVLESGATGMAASAMFAHVTQSEIEDITAVFKASRAC